MAHQGLGRHRPSPFFLPPAGNMSPIRHPRHGRLTFATVQHRPQKPAGAGMGIVDMEKILLVLAGALTFLFVVLLLRGC